MSVIPGNGTALGNIGESLLPVICQSAIASHLPVRVHVCYDGAGGRLAVCPCPLAVCARYYAFVVPFLLSWPLPVRNGVRHAF